MASSKKQLNVDSPVFTPGTGQSPLRKTATLSMQAASAIPFTPRGTSVVSTSNASSAASPREQLRDLVAPKEPGQMMMTSRGDAAPAFNVATAREFVPRSAERTPPNYNVALAKEFLPRGDRSPFNVAQAVEFRPQSQTVPPAALSSSAASSAAPIHTLHSSPETTQQSLHLQQVTPSNHTTTSTTPASAAASAAAAAASATLTTVTATSQQQPQSLATSHPPLQAPTQPSAHVHIPTGPSQGSQVSIPTGPSRLSAISHANSNIDGHIGSSSSSNRAGHAAATAAAAAAASMAGLTMTGLSYGLAPGTDAAAALYDSYGVAGAGVTPFNPYAAASQGAGREGAAYFQSQAAFGPQHQPLNEHLYFPQGPHRQDLLPRQRVVHDFFLPEKLRQEVHMKSRAGSQAALTLSVNVESYHSLTPLDTNSHKVAGSFGRITWLYKAVASKNGKHYCLRRLENFRVSHENALREARDWRRVNCGSVVTVHEAFTTRAFGDSSVVFATDYYPLSVTLMQYHFPTYGQNRPRGNVTIQENILWGYFVQITNALRAIHSAGLAARSLDLTKIIRTGKNRIRLSGCAVQDVINYDPTRRVLDLQQDDFVKFGEVMLALATYTPPSELKQPYAPMEQIPDIYSHELKAAVAWLLAPPPPPPQPSTPSAPAGPSSPSSSPPAAAAVATSSPKNIEALVTGIASQMTRFFDLSLQENDGLMSMVYREVENGRVARMLLKLGMINERESYQRDPLWAEHGPRYPLKLFRDYVFHQVDESGRPVIDVWHMLSCLNKLDAGSNEVVRLSSRDGRTNLFVTYKELNKMVQRSFNDLMRASRR